MDVPESARKTETCHIWLDDGVLYQVMFYGALETEATARENYEVMLELTGGEPPWCLADMRFIRGVDSGARALYGKVGAMAAGALVVESAISRVIGNVFLGINRPSYPIRLFNEVESAADWLRSQRRARS